MKRHPDGDALAERLARALGWFSLGLGAAEIAAPQTVARLAGMRRDERTQSMLRTLGTREIAHGVSLLTQPHRPEWLWARVCGDALDLACFAAAREPRRGNAGPVKAAATAAALLGVAGLDLLGAVRLRSAQAHGRTAERTAREADVFVERAITINRPVGEVYGFWRHFENLPRFMRRLEQVEILDERRSRWTARGPARLAIRWEAELVMDQPDEWISWQSLDESRVRHSVTVRFQPAPGHRGTEVRVQLQNSPPAGALGRTLAWLVGEEPGQQLRDDLRRLKQLMETGEIPISEGPGLRRAARPAARPEKLRTLAGVHP